VATNIVPDACEVAGECRGHDEGRLADVAAAMVDALHRSAVEAGVDVDVDLVDEFRTFRLEEGSPVVDLAKTAVAAAGLKPELRSAGGGSDANVLNAMGIPTVNLAAGMMRVHSADEYLSLDELERLCEVVLQLICTAGMRQSGIRGGGAH
jgi:tripeptide aminopeptidase